MVLMASFLRTHLILQSYLQLERKEGRERPHLRLHLTLKSIKVAVVKRTMLRHLKIIDQL